jgi:hypothetical protein
MNYYYGKVVIDGVSVTVMLTEKETQKTSERAMDNIEKVPSEITEGDCWDVECCRTTKCSLLKRIMGKCCDCDG